MPLRSFKTWCDKWLDRTQHDNKFFDHVNIDWLLFTKTSNEARAEMNNRFRKNKDY